MHSSVTAMEASGQHLIQCEIQVLMITPNRIIDGSRANKYIQFIIIKLYPEAADEPPPDTSAAEV